VAWVRPASLLASAGADGGAKLWSRAADGEEWAEAATLAPPPALAPAAGPSAAVATHPSSDYVVLASAAGAWTLYDVATAAALASVDDTASAGGGGFASAAFHPDGVILGAGTTAGAVHVWDARVQKAVASFDGHAGSVAGLAFSENGYHAAAASTDGVRLWDLRKMKVVASAGGPGGGDGAAATGVAFDPAGLLLAAAGPGGVAVLGAKTGLDTLFAAADGRKGALSVAWAPDGGVLWGGGGDHNLRRYAVEG
jgi:pre-mRNA-processing factor 19